MEIAPLYTEITDGPDQGQAYWLRTDDGVRIRAGVWAHEGAKGTVLLFPGRTEYVEKYGRTASDLAQCGYASCVIDWRGQGLSDRLISDPMPGHVIRFSDYQKDIDALLEMATELNLPKPWHLLGHSMGGGIGLQAIYNGLPVASCAFSGPMWGISISPQMRPVAWTLSTLAQKVGLGHIYTPGTSRESYVLQEAFEDNKLTNDRPMYDYMIDQVRTKPDLGLGGPSMGWLIEALKATRQMQRLASPDLPCFTFYGSLEAIVDVPRIEDRMTRWPNGTLHVVEGGHHELLMDTPDIRADITRKLCDHFDQAATDLDQRSGSDDQDQKQSAPSHPPRSNSAVA
ncbi:alpha/beta fold hydrolase [Roseovarius sp. EL26]|uniref:alpha/beta fold hydrolase n=1 Tax=Roseovarius sp. EL26 TaxID=2126672 RepID=UPI000EA3E371|nr:alpha/beta hydrolase [Roseovarius sp. EL26]